MKSRRARSLLFFLLLFAVAALALDASYTQGSGSGGQQREQMRNHMPGEGIDDHELTPAEKREPCAGEMVREQ